MSGKTKIEWADRVWNPTVGCTPVSAGCAHCYAKRMYDRFFQSKPFSEVQLHPIRLVDPQKWKVPARVFVNSMSDLFHEDVRFSYVEMVFVAMSKSPRHTFMVLTKRPERMNEYFEDNRRRNIEVVLDNVWLGVSVEDQKTADERIPLLLQTPPAKRFVSVEPMLGAVDLEPFLKLPPLHVDIKGKSTWSGIDWVICGGESGPGARPMRADWARGLRDQCVAAGVPFFFKQWGEYIHLDTGAVMNDRKKFQRILDGRAWNEYPNESLLTHSVSSRDSQEHAREVE